MNEREKMINAALTRDADLDSNEYRAKSEKADQSTKAHGAQGKAPLSEALRHKRIQSNYYGTSLNVGLSQLSELSGISGVLNDIALLLFASLTHEQKKEYLAMRQKDEGEARHE